MTGCPRVATIITRLEGGAGIMALRGAKAVHPQRCDVTLITGRGGRLLDEARAAGIPTIVEPALCTPISPWQDLIALRRLRILLRREHFDVVHTHCAKAGALGRLCAHQVGISQIVHTYHGFPFHDFQRAPRRRAYIGIERRLGRITDRTLCVGSGVAAEALRLGLTTPDRIRAIGVAVNHDIPAATRETRRQARLALGLPEEAVVVGAVGRLTYQKAPEDFVAAMWALVRRGVSGAREVIGVWIGDGDEAARISRLAEGAPVRLAGDRADVPILLPAFDVFVLPSRYEGVPLAIVEAMRCGIPVVATAVNAVSDVVVAGETGLLVPPERPDLLSEAVAYLLDSPGIAARMAAAARAHVHGRHTVDALAEVLVSSYGYCGSQ